MYILNNFLNKLNYKILYKKLKNMNKMPSAQPPLDYSTTSVKIK